jgi:flavin reductase (DIM6/NTAB) family NADH-FMN oxidoreductase RutF
MRTPVALNHAYRLLNHGPATLITSAALGRRNVMAAAWVVPLDGSVIGAVVGSGSLTRELIEKSGELAISIPR